MPEAASVDEKTPVKVFKTEISWPRSSDLTLTPTSLTGHECKIAGTQAPDRSEAHKE